ncbi:hypothetical protein L1I30_02835 [Gillisia sp. M10.2A]|uniref:Aspartyl protease n=1 Tax=Gillisia lutea TaxID=2909668 RepID=A0ABS9ECI7_9FLAO|nr:hypothetical protein [Gillisia lutea]MCF4100594.1 hypothetical protein [Gillisia lutea]
MRKSLLIILILLGSFSSQATEFEEGLVFPKAEILNEYTARIPFKLIDNLIVVEAELLDKKGNFIIDTGSESLILNKVHFSQRFYSSRKSTSTSGVIRSIDGVYTRNLKEFILKNFSINNATSDVIDLSHIEKRKKMNLLGIIGYNILKEYEVFIDLHLNQITLSKVDKNGVKLDKEVYLEKITDSIAFRLNRHTIILDTYIDGNKMKFGLDSGAEFNQINKNGNNKILKFFLPNKKLILVGSGGEKAEVLAGKLYGIKLTDNIYFGPMNTILTNLSRMQEAFGTHLDGILGYQFFAQKRTIINYQKKMLYFIDFPLNFNP